MYMDHVQKSEKGLFLVPLKPLFLRNWHKSQTQKAIKINPIYMPNAQLPGIS